MVTPTQSSVALLSLLMVQLYQRTDKTRPSTFSDLGAQPGRVL